MYDVIVIGAGVVGCAVARELSRRRLSIAVLERKADIADGTSKANTGIVHAGHDAEPGSQKAKYNRLGAAMYPELCRELSVAYKQNGTLVVAFSDAQLPALDALLKQAQQNGIEHCRIVGERELRELEPNIGRDAKGALFAESGGIVCPYGFTVALAENAAANGAEFFCEREVTAISRRAGGGFTVTTAAGNCECRVLVNCAGLYADAVNNMLSEKKYRITPRRGEYLIIDKTHGGDFTRTIFQVPQKLATGHTKGIVIAPTVDGTIMLGPTADDIECKDDLANTGAGFDAVLKGAALSWNDIPRGDIISCFAGNRAHCDAGDFVVGEAPDVPGFFNCLGIESPGLTSAPAIAVDIAAAVSAELGAEPRDDFVAERRVPKPFREMDERERAAAIKSNPEYGVIVCRCETVTEAEVHAAIRAPAGARTLDGVKRRTRAGMGRCQSGFCQSRVAEILCEELGTTLCGVTKDGAGSEIAVGPVFTEDK